LPEFNLVQFDADLPISQHIDHYLRKHQVPAKIRHRFDNIDTIKSYLANSREVAILPAFTVKPEVDAGQLTAIALVPTLVRPLAIVVDRKRQVTPLMQAFMDDLLSRSPNGAAQEAAEPASTTA
jgi:DNA-binding transcriptional LysR family regulator